MIFSLLFTSFLRAGVRVFSTQETFLDGGTASQIFIEYNSCMTKTQCAPQRDIKNEETSEIGLKKRRGKKEQIGLKRRNDFSLQFHTKSRQNPALPQFCMRLILYFIEVISNAH